MAPSNCAHDRKWIVAKTVQTVDSLDSPVVGVVLHSIVVPFSAGKDEAVGQQIFLGYSRCIQHA